MNGELVDLNIPAREPWMDDAMCAQTDPEVFFPEKGGSTRAAKLICASCEVAAICLDYALRNDERFGVYGGKSERERRRMRIPKERWTDADQAQLVELYAAGMLDGAIASRMGRPRTTITVKRQLMGPPMGRRGGGRL